MDNRFLYIVAFYISFLLVIVLSFFLLSFSTITTSLFWFFFFGVVLISMYSLTQLTTAESKKGVIINVTNKRKGSSVIRMGNTLKIMTLNIAHGRNDSPHQIFQSKEHIQKQLSAIADLVRKHQSTIVTLQETDNPTFWSNYIDQTASIAQDTALDWHVHSDHVDGLGVHYGTSIISRFKLTDAVSHTFTPSPPTFAKGFTLTSAVLNNEQIIDIVSLQLDFSKKSIRHRQISEMITVLKSRNNPLIVTGDFNNDWHAKNSIVQKCASVLQLKAFNPHSKIILTFPTLGKRLDWILISQGLSFESYETLTDVVSDHYAVIASITFDPKKT